MEVNAAHRALFSKKSVSFSEEKVREVLAALDGGSDWSSVFARACGIEKWKDALAVLQGMQTLKATLPAQPAWAVAAMCQATLADFAPVPVLRLLAADSSKAAQAAIAADLERHLTAGDDGLIEERVKHLEKVPALAAYCARMREVLAGRSSGRAAGSVGEAIGLGAPLPKLSVTLPGAGSQWLRLSGTEALGELQGYCSVVNGKVFPRSADELSQWVGEITRQGSVQWTWDEIELRVKLTPAQKKALVAWLKAAAGQ